jgi:hypothetical protein
MKGKKKMIYGGIGLFCVVALAGGSWYMLGRSSKENTEKPSQTELSVKKTDKKLDDKKNMNGTSKIITKSSNEGYQFEDNGSGGKEPLSDEEYQKNIDKNSTVGNTVETVDENTTRVVEERIREAISSFPKINPTASSSPEMYQFYEVSEKYFGDKSSKIRELQNLIQTNNVEVSTINLGKLPDKNKVAYEFVISNSDNKEQLGYVTGEYDLEKQILNVSYATKLRDGQIVTNKFLDAHKQF